MSNRVISKERNYGLDLARVLAMFLVVLFHLSNWGVGAEGWGAVRRWFVCFSEPCVDLFALLSGFLVRGKWKFSKFFRLWGQVVFTGFMTALICRYVFGMECSTVALVKTFFPIITDQYWYFTAWAGLFVLLPILNRGLMGISARELLVPSVLALFLFSLSTLLPEHDLYSNRGFSTFWLLLLYIVGYVIRCHVDSIRLSSTWAMVLAIICSLVPWFQWELIVHSPSVARVFRNQPTFCTYTSPSVVLCACMFLIACVKMKINSHLFKRLLLFFAPTAFGVYLIHLQKVFWHGFWMKGGFSLLGG